MSGGNCPETPRQKMIGMMYLFLTAMLAVNVSSTVLNGFTLVDESLRTNNEIFDGNNAAVYSALKFQYENNKTKFGPAYNKSLEIRKQADELYTLIDTGKWMVARVCDGPLGDPYHIQAKDNVDAGFQALILKTIGSKEPTYASLIKGGINDFRDFLLLGVDEKTAGSIKKCLDTSDPVPSADAHGGHGDVEKNISWEETMFTGIPVGAVMALMTKMQADIRNTESMALTQLVSQVTADDLKVNKIQAHIIPFKSYMIKGASFNARALLAATDSTQTPSYELYVNGNFVKPINKKGEYVIPCTSTGVFEVSGNIISKDDKGNDNKYPFAPITYEVADPFATVSATKMNVIYAGVDNPMSISVPGFSSNDIKPSLSDGSPLVAVNGGYILKPRKAGKENDGIF